MLKINVIYVLNRFKTKGSFYTAAMNAAKRVCVLGAGIGGLHSARHLKAEGINFTVLEATNYLGGTWRYEENIGKDEYGQPIFTSMYQNLRTNLPKPTMEFPDFPFPEGTPSYPDHNVFYDYIKSYAKHFDLAKYIKFLHPVTSVKRVKNVWEVQYKHLPTGKEYQENFDYVIVATGHHTKPHMPSIPGEKLFKGTIIHSHDFRTTDPYKARRVLIIGYGASGMDIGIDVGRVSKTLVHSHHSPSKISTPYPPHYITKPDIKEFNETGVTFIDGTHEEIDDVIYCTGYEYDLPYLDESCGVTVTTTNVTPLYKYMVNINQPTMIFIGALFKACLVIALDAQARYTVAMIKGNFTLPTQEEMLYDWQKQYDELLASGKPPSHIHELGEKENEYYADLARAAGTCVVPPVFCKIRSMEIVAKLENLYTHRSYAYEVIDNETFTRTFVGDEPSKNTSTSKTKSP